MTMLRRNLMVVCLLTLTLLLVSHVRSGSDQEIPLDLRLKMEAGWPDVKEGIPITKVAGFVWARGHIIEEYRSDFIRAHLVYQQKGVLPYAAEYTFYEGKLTNFELKEVKEQPDFDAISKKWFENEPWVLIDRSIYGYNFKVAPAWSVVFEKSHEMFDFQFDFTALGLPKTYDDEVKQWIENSIQWTVFNRDETYKDPAEVKVSAERILKMQGNTFTKITPVENSNNSTFIYETEFQGKPYLGKTVYLVNDGKGFAVRFNATKNTYLKNIDKFETFIKHFNLSSKRVDKPDMELRREGNMVLSIIGDSYSSEEMEDLTTITLRGDFPGDPNDPKSKKAE